MLLWLTLLFSFLAEGLLRLLQTRLSDRATQLLSGSAIFLMFGAQAGLIGDTMSPFAVLLLMVGLGRFVHLGRFFVHRLERSELLYRTRRSFARFVAIYTVLLTGWWLNSRYFIEWDVLVAAGSLIFSGLCFAIMLKRLRAASVRTNEDLSLSDAKSPTLSVCVPARNETQDLAFCLTSVVENDYQKLEILVLDDCSHDKTPEIIKSFAHKGVRFIKGEEPGSDWLPKNAAYQKLYDETSSEFLLFMGVDVRLKPQSLRRLVAYAVSKDLDMVSVLPSRGATADGNSLFQIIRYWWELAIPSMLRKQRPPVLSSCWLVRKSAFKKLGGFGAYRRSVKPEAHFAKRLGNRYAFVRSGSAIEVESVKSTKEQRATALRVRYPSLRKQPEAVTLLVLLQVMTPVSFGVAILSQNNFALVLSTLAGLLQMVMFVITAVVMKSFPAHLWLALVLLPLLDAAQSIVSMVRYEFGNVTWKDRNICMPMLVYERSLPDIDNKTN